MFYCGALARSIVELSVSSSHGRSGLQIVLSILALRGPQHGMVAATFCALGLSGNSNITASFPTTKLNPRAAEYLRFLTSHPSAAFSLGASTAARPRLGKLGNFGQRRSSGAGRDSAITARVMPRKNGKFQERSSLNRPHASSKSSIEPRAMMTRCQGVRCAMLNLARHRCRMRQSARSLRSGARP